MQPARLMGKHTRKQTYKQKKDINTKHKDIKRMVTADAVEFCTGVCCQFC